MHLKYLEGAEAVQDTANIEVELIRRCQRGDPEAFDELYYRFGDAVWRLCCRMTHNGADAEDLTQDVWVTVWEQIGTFRSESAFRTWLYRVATNVCLQWLRRRGKATCSIEGCPDQPAPDPEAKLNGQEGLRRLLSAVADLPESLRLPLVLRAEEKLSYGEIGEALGCTTAAVKMRISHARAALAEVMKEEPV